MSSTAWGINVTSDGQVTWESPVDGPKPDAYLVQHTWHAEGWKTLPQPVTDPLIATIPTDASHVRIGSVWQGSGEVVWSPPNEIRGAGDIARPIQRLADDDDPDTIEAIADALADETADIDTDVKWTRTKLKEQIIDARLRGDRRAARRARRMLRAMRSEDG